MKKKHLIISLVICGFSIIGLILVFIHTIGIGKDNIKSALEIEGANSVGVIADRFNQTFAIIDNMNLQIKENPQDTKYINSIIAKYKTSPNLVDNFSWTFFSWADNSDHLTVDAMNGIIKKPVDASVDNYIVFAKQNPGKFYLERPTIGLLSKKWMIPGGVGLRNKNGDYVGTMKIGFEIDALARIIQRSLKNKNIKATLVYKNGNVPVLEVNSKNYNSFQHREEKIGDKKITQILEQLKFSNNQVSDIALITGQYGYLARQIDNYPFVVVLEYDKNVIVSELWSSIISRVYEIIFIILATVALLYLVYKRERDLAQKKVSEILNLHLQSLTKSISHDLRNYISGIDELAQMIIELENHDNKPTALSNEEDENRKKEIIKYARMIDSQAHLMLDFSKVLVSDEGIKTSVEKIINGHKLVESADSNPKNNLEDINVGEMIEELIFLSQPFIKTHEVKVKIDIEPGLPMLHTNRMELHKILDNLIANAVKYTNKGGEVVIKSRVVSKKPRVVSQKSKENSLFSTLNSRLSTKLYIEISDNGIGMSKEDIAMALAGQGKDIDKSALDKPFDSHGIGMPMVKHAIESLGATMEIESEKGPGEHQGTTIKLWFKIAQNLAASSQKPDSQKSEENKKPVDQIVNVNSSLSATIQTILFADDDHVMRLMVNHQLTNLGFKVILAKNGQEVLEILDSKDSKNYCDLVIMDTSMEKLGDGFEITKTIRSGTVFKIFKEFKTIPIVALSANSDQESKNLSVVSGMNFYLEKPFDREKFLEIIYNVE